MAEIINLFPTTNQANQDTVRVNVFEYAQFVYSLDKEALLQQMVRHQEEISNVGGLTPKLIAEGMVLFKELHAIAETPALRSLTKGYLKHLKEEASIRGVVVNG